MIEHLLRYYTDLTQHNRTKITFLVSIYIGFTQLLIFMPPDKLHAVKTDLAIANTLKDVILFGGGIGAFLIVLIVGICHHICNLIANCTQRIKCELRVLIDDRRATHNTWLMHLDRLTTNRFSLSQVSAILALTFMGLFMILTSVQFARVLDCLFEKSHAIGVFLGVYFTVEVAVLVFYGCIALRRCKQFYFIRRLLRGMQRGNENEALLILLQRKGVTVTEKDLIPELKGLPTP